MGGRSKWEYFREIFGRYRGGSRQEKGKILEEFCRVCGYNRKYAIRKLSGLPPGRKPRVRRRGVRGPHYGSQVISILRGVWEAAGYPWSVRLKAMVPLWMPWIRRHFRPSPEVERQLLSISARQIDRRLGGSKRRLKRRFYGRTKPGTLLKHHIPIRTDNWDVTVPGFGEVDLVSHSGNSGDGRFAYSLNFTDIHTAWVETQAILGKGRETVREALEEIRGRLPFPLSGIDSDNGSEFINDSLWTYCKDLKIQFTRGRPYKKDDNAHIEQKNWTHVRKLIGWERFDTQKATDVINGLYGREWRLMMNLFQPSVKLMRKVRVGSRLTRKYDKPQTPLDRLLACAEGHAEKLKDLKKLRDSLDPFELARSIDRKLEKIAGLSSRPAISVPTSHRKLENLPGHRPSHLQIGPHRSAKRKKVLSTSETKRKLRIA
jgi:hypothetical protein